MCSCRPGIRLRKPRSRRSPARTRRRQPMSAGSSRESVWTRWDRSPDAHTQLLAQFADVALDNALFHVVVEQAVDRVEDLRLADATTSVDDEMFEDAAFATRQHERITGHFRIAPVEEHADRIASCGHGRLFEASADSTTARHQFAHVHGLADDIVHARLEEMQRLVERSDVDQRHCRDCATATDGARMLGAARVVADQDALDRRQVRPAERLDPAREITRREAAERDTLTREGTCKSVANTRTRIDNDEHEAPHELKTTADGASARREASASSPIWRSVVNFRLKPSSAK